MNAVEKYNRRADLVHSLVCVGLDSDYQHLPDSAKNFEYAQFAFNRRIIELTHPFVGAYKANMAFYEARAARGLTALKLTMEYLQDKHPDILTICDAKRGDIDSTSAAYARAIFDWLGFDAVTLNPYMGRDSLRPFLERPQKGCIIVCRTSNPGAGDLQDLPVDGQPLWQIVARKVCHEWNENNNCMLVMGATSPEQIRQARAIAGEMTLLIPGVGRQGGDAAEAVRAGLNSGKKGLIINSSRGIIFAEHPDEAARELRDLIQQAIAEQS